MSDIDLSELAIQRGGAAAGNVRARRHVFTRYLLPGVLLLAFLSVMTWSAWEIIFPARPVTVVPVMVTTTESQQEGTPLFQAAGWIEPRPTPVRAAALAPGVVEKLLVVEDQPVKAGEPVAELVKDDAKLAYEKAAANLELRQAELDQARATLSAANIRFQQPVHLESPLQQSRASLAKVETLLKNLPFEIRRAEAEFAALQKDYEGKVAAEGVVAQVAIDIAKSKADAAKAMVEELRDRVGSLKKERIALAERRDALRRELELLTEETKAKDEAQALVRASSARLAQARVLLAETKLQLDRMTVVSPIDARVFRLIATPGARIGSGMTQMEGHDGSTVVTLYRPEMLQARVDVRFQDIPQVTLGQPVEIHNPALSESLIGKVLFISSEADIQKNTLQVKVAIPDPPPVFKPEMLVDVTFLSVRTASSSKPPQSAMRILVPTQLIQREGDQAIVWLADQSAGIARKQSIQTGSTGGDGMTEVIAGLTVSSRVITSSIDELKDGCRIRVTAEDPMIGTSVRIQSRDALN